MSVFACTATRPLRLRKHQASMRSSSPFETVRSRFVVLRSKRKTYCGGSP